MDAILESIVLEERLLLPSESAKETIDSMMLFCSFVNSFLGDLSISLHPMKLITIKIHNNVLIVKILFLVGLDFLL